MSFSIKLRSTCEVCCSVLQCAVSHVLWVSCDTRMWHSQVCCSVLQCIAVCCSVLQCIPLYCESWVGSLMWHSHSKCVTCETHLPNVWPDNLWVSFPNVRYDSFICVTWLIHLFHMTHSSVWHDSFIHVWHDSCDMTQSSMWHGTSHSYGWYELFIRVPWPIYLSDMTGMSYVTHMSGSCHTYMNE